MQKTVEHSAAATIKKKKKRARGNVLHRANGGAHRPLKRKKKRDPFLRMVSDHSRHFTFFFLLFLYILSDTFKSKKARWANNTLRRKLCVCSVRVSFNLSLSLLFL
jgi:hypothetical protein